MNMLPMTESRYSIPFFCLASILLGMAAMNLTEPTKPDVVVRNILVWVYGLGTAAAVGLLITMTVTRQIEITPEIIFRVVMCIVIFTVVLEFRRHIINTRRYVSD